MAISSCTPAAALGSTPGISLSSQRIVLKSAFRPPAPSQRQRWSRNVSVLSSNFKRFEITYLEGGPMSGKSYIKQTTTREVISVADRSTWTTLESSDDDYNFDVKGLGFIGKGSTKCAIYVCLDF